MAASQFDLSRFQVPVSKRINLQDDYDPADTGEYRNKTEAKAKLLQDVEQLGIYQDILYAQNTYALLVIFQAMDAAGKDSTIKHVMSGVNPQGCQVFSFKSPSSEELDHDYLWRSFRCLPERGRIGIFNRSYYEETLIVRVHPEILTQQQLPPQGGHKDGSKQHGANKDLWQQRFEEINHFEKYLVNNGIIVLKFFLNVSKAEQKKRFLERIENPEKHWKFSAVDVQERQFWQDYQQVYQEVFQHTSTDWAPWYIIPADHKWFTRLVVANIICQKLKALKLAYPKVEGDRKATLEQARQLLLQESSADRTVP